MTDAAALDSRRTASAPPRIGFVSLGCPKALTDSELILTRLAGRGLRDVEDLRGRRPGDRQHLRLHRRRGAREPRHDRRGARRQRQGRRHRLPRRQGRRRAARNLVRQMHPSVLAVTGPHATDEVMDAVHTHLPKPHDPFVDLVPPPRDRHQADAEALRLPEDQRRLQPPLHVLHHPEPARRPGLAADRRRASARRRRCSSRASRSCSSSARTRARTASTQRFRTGFWNGRPVKTQLLELVRAARRDRRAARRLGPAALRLPVPARRRRAAADGDRRASCRTSTCRSSTRTPTCCAA